MTMDGESRIYRAVDVEIVEVTHTHNVVVPSGGVALGSAGWSADTERPERTERPSRCRAGRVKINTPPSTD